MAAMPYPSQEAQRREPVCKRHVVGSSAAARQPCIEKRHTARHATGHRPQPVSGSRRARLCRFSRHLRLRPTRPSIAQRLAVQRGALSPRRLGKGAIGHMQASPARTPPPRGTAHGESGSLRMG